MKQLPKHGWEIRLIEDNERSEAGAEWFIEEIWVIESIWSPKGFQAYVSFVIDPGEDIFDSKHWKSVWAVKASLRRPTGWGIEEDEVGLILGRGWEQRMPEFFRRLSALRMRGGRVD